MDGDGGKHFLCSGCVKIRVPVRMLRRFWGNSINKFLSKEEMDECRKKITEIDQAIDKMRHIKSILEVIKERSL
jgi:hypothetical protein